MEKVGVSRFRKNLTVFFKKIKSGQSITITSRGNDIAKLVPLENKMEESKRVLKKLGETAIIGDILSPIEENWDATK